MEGLSGYIADRLRAAWAVAWPVLVLIALVAGFAILFVVAF